MMGHQKITKAVYNSAQQLQKGENMARKDQLRLKNRQFQALARLGHFRKEETASRTAAYYIIVEGMSIKDAANRAGCTYTAAYVAVRKLEARYEQACVACRT